MAGKSHQDIELAARVRSLTLQECERQLLKKKGRLYEGVLFRLAGTVLPRLNEHGGFGGKDFVIQISAQSAKRYGIASNASRSGGKQETIPSVVLRAEMGKDDISDRSDES